MKANSIIRRGLVLHNDNNNSNNNNNSNSNNNNDSYDNNNKQAHFNKKKKNAVDLKPPDIKHPDFSSANYCHIL